MKHSTPAAVVSFLALLIGVGAARASDALAENFKNPPDAARPHTWWHWMNGNVTREGITKDLEAMKRVGLGGFQAFHVTDGIPAGPVGYMSDPWLELMGHTVKEAQRLGLEMCFHNCAGWSSSGGPWISPELSMQEVVWTETSVRGGAMVEVTLKQPEGRKDFYRDIAVVAFARLGGDGRRSGSSQKDAQTPASGGADFRLEKWEWKSNRNARGRKPDSQIERDTREAPAEDVIKLADVVVLTDKMDASGKLTWNAPPAPAPAREWTIIRFGHTTTGRTNKPAPPEGVGLECNKLDRAAVKLHWDNSVARVLEQAGPAAGKVFNNVLIDSYEVGFQNWTSGLEKTFSQRLRYELTKYMPCLTGRVVESVDTSERFLWDFRRLIADLMAENYFGYFKELCHQKGLVLSIEPYGPGGFDDFQVAAIADIAMGEFWIDRPDAWHEWSVKLASSAMHAAGRAVVGAESFTANPPASAWNDYPSRIKTLGDRFFAQGLNRIIFHTNVHQPWADDVLPGMTMGPHGMQMNRNNTWHQHARPWVDHLARTQFLLQAGEPMIDLCYIAAENAPQTPLKRSALKPVPPDGYDYDMLHYWFVMQMNVKDGRLVLPSGMSYAVLVLPDADRMRPELLGKIVELKKAGATIYAPRKIVASPSLAGHPGVDDKVLTLNDNLRAGGELADLLPPADFEPAADTPVAWLHRRIGERDVYFISNQEPQNLSVAVLMRAQGEPEIWRTEDGTIERLTDFEQALDGRTFVRMELGPMESVFVVFSKKSSAPEAKSFVASSETSLDGPWTARFGSQEIELPKLISWSEHEKQQVRHFSGTATYTATFDAPADVKAGMMDLGDVQVMAQVKLNGKDLGLLWKPSFVVDVSEAIRAGENELEVSVTNTWANRLIGDERYPPLGEWRDDARGRGSALAAIPQWLLQRERMPPTQRQTFSTWRHFKKDDPLRPAGLLGPVVVRFAR